VERLLEYAQRASALTHRHFRSQMACGGYCLLAATLLRGAEPAEAYQHTIETMSHHYRQPPYAAELPHFERLLSGHLGALSEEDIPSTGYVVHTLEASIWCLLNTNSFGEAVLRAVNLGDDTDTTATVTGGLAGIHYGELAVPVLWRHQLARNEELGQLFEAFVSVCEPSA
jgi:ADP-ribosylglycohydrolase